MYSEERFIEIEEYLDDAARNYSGSSRNDELAQTLLITAVELNRIHRFREEKHPDVLEAGHQYQVIFFLKGVQTLFAVCQLTKYYRYDSAYRDLRYLFETYFLIRGLNHDKEKAAEIALEELEEVRESGDDERFVKDPVSTDKLFGVMRRERKRAEESIDEMSTIYQFLSTRSSHPVRMDGAALDGSHQEEAERQILTFALYLAYGLTRELLRTYLDTSAADVIQAESQGIVRRFDEVLGYDVPVFLTDEY